ncbi:aminotransferase B [Candidatus Symbiothrix dinenymphae]|nr:aminotransferase B [Candidatus Symbiothrix dinenymphae]
MHYNFDEILNRKGTGALKVDALEERFGNADLIPLWVADMDFRCCDSIVEALRKRCDLGIFGYSTTPDEYVQAIVNWLQTKHRWTVSREWLSYIPGVVKGIALSIMHFTTPSDKVIIQPPVYHPFNIVPTLHGREVVLNPLLEKNGHYSMDLEGLRQVIDKDCKLLILANPHNPVGITWDKKTLQELAKICAEHHILVIADEIHSDLAIFGHEHIPFATVSKEAEQNSITLMAPSKTFNIAGIVSSYAIIPNKAIRDSFYKFLAASELNEGTIFAYTATTAAYNGGSEWLSQMLTYIEGNIQFVDEYLKANIPQIKAIIPEASFLLWLDCRELKLSQPDLVMLFKDKAGLALNNGKMFGKEGIGFMRMNVGCPRSVLKQALNQLSVSVSL